MTDAPDHRSPHRGRPPHRGSPGAPGAFDVLLTRVDGTIDLVMGRHREGWSKLDLSADGFWNSFLAIPASLPALLVVWLSHGRFLIEEGASLPLGAVVLAYAAIELVIWIATITAFVVLAGPARLSDRLVPTVIAANWVSVPIAYAQAVPAAIALLAGMGPGIAFVALVVQVMVLVAFWRTLAAALERSWPIVLGAFLVTLVIGFALVDLGQGLFGLTTA